MRIYIAKDGEALRKIAYHLKVMLKDLLSLNQHMPSPDAIISGMPIKLPPYRISVEDQEQIATSPRQTNLRNEWIPLTPLEKMAETEYDVQKKQSTDSSIPTPLSAQSFFCQSLKPAAFRFGRQLLRSRDHHRK